MISRRKCSAIILAALAAVILSGVLAFPQLVGFMADVHRITGLPVCMLNDWFDIRCPLCGGTRCCVAILNGDFGMAVYYNPLVPVMAVAFVVWYITAAVRLMTGKTDSVIPSNRVMCVLLTAVVLFFVIRNTPFYRLILY